MSNIPITLNIDDSQLNEALAKLDQGLGRAGQTTGGSVDSVQKKAQDVIANEGEKIKGLDSATGRIIRMIPGLREAERLRNSLGQLSTGSVAGALGIVMLAYSIYRQVAQIIEEQKRQQQKYQQQVNELRDFASSVQFQEWERTQRQIADGYRTRSIP